MKKILLTSILALISTCSVAQIHLDLTNCFLQKNGNLICYDKKTGKQITIRQG